MRAPMPTLDDTLMATLADPNARVDARERAFRELVRRHSAVLAATLRVLLRDGSAVDDALQETFLRVYQASARYAPGGAPFRSWLLRIGRNLALDALRKRARRGTGSRSFKGSR